MRIICSIIALRHRSLANALESSVFSSFNDTTTVGTVTNGHSSQQMVSIRHASAAYDISSAEAYFKKSMTAKAVRGLETRLQEEIINIPRMRLSVIQIKY